METKNTITTAHAIILIIGVVLLLGNLLVASIPSRLSHVFFWSMMILFGVMHGVGDIDEITTLYKKKSKTTLIVIYSSLMIVTAIGRYLAPLLTTVIFVIVGAYHFGNEHREAYKIHGSLVTLHNTLRGACVLISLIGFQRAYSATILTPIIGAVEISSNMILWTFGIVVSSRLIVHYYQYAHKIGYRAAATEIGLLIIISLLAYTTNFYISFGFYFGIAHGLPQIITLNKSSLQKMKSQYLDLLTTYPGMILSTIVVRIIWYFLARYWFPTAQLMMLFLMFLSILTIPNVLMERYPSTRTRQ